MKKLSLILITLFTLLFAYSVSANIVTPDPYSTLANNSYQNVSTVIPGINVTGNSTSWWCGLYSDQNGSNGIGNYRQIQVNSGVSNATATNFSSWTLADARNYTWAVKCNSTRDPHGNWTVGGNQVASNFSFTIDTTAPSVTSLSPQRELNLFQSFGNKWVNRAMGNGSVRVGINVTDDNPSTCELFMNFNHLLNTTASNHSLHVQSYVNGTAFNFSVLNNTVANELPESNASSGAGYLYHINCRDLAGNWESVNGSFKVDTFLPGTFAFNVSQGAYMTNNRFLGGNTNHTTTDYTPQIGFGKTSEPNFWRVGVNFFTGVFSNYTGLVQTNVTSNTTRLVNISSLAGDRTYRIVLTAYDLAGNPRNMSSLSYSYSTTSTNRVLSAGWNIIGNIGGSFNLSDLLDWSGATTVSIWNVTHQFQSHVEGGSNAATLVKAGEPVLLYLSSAITLSDLIQNTSAYSVSHNLTNQTSSDWNLLMNRNSTKLDGFDMQRIDVYLNGNSSAGVQKAVDLNMSFASVYNNSASSGSKYIPFVGNWSVNNQTRIKFGQVSWFFYDSTSGAADRQNVTFNWGTVCHGNHTVYGAGTVCER